jgi:thioredoxin 2
MAPIFERAARDLEPRARFLKVNVDQAPELAAKYGVQIPALFLLKNGMVAAKNAGVATLALLHR